jgi:RNA polymerase sigma factor (sigma-70 family)
MTDRELLDQFVAECNDRVFETLVRTHGGMVFGVCRRILRNDHDAEEAFQATFLVLAKKAGSISRREALANWLYGVARRIALKARATRAKRFAREQQVESIPEVEDGKPDRSPEIEALLDAGLSRLPEKYRLAVVLCDLEGKSYREAGQELGCPEGTVSSRLTRARATLAKWFHRQGFLLSIGSLAVLLSQKSASASLPASLVASTAKAASLSALGQPIGGSVIAPQVSALANGVLKSMFFTTLKHAAAALIALISIAVAIPGLVYWLQAAERPGRDQKTQQSVSLPEPLALLEKYERALVPYNRMKGIWTIHIYDWKPGQEPRLRDQVEECTVLRDGDRARLFYKTTGGKRKTPRLWEELLHKGQRSVRTSNDDNAVGGRLNVSEEDFLERFGVPRSSPGYGVVDGKSIPAFLRTSTLSVRADTLDGSACFALRGLLDECDITVWLDPALDYVARRVVFHKRSSPGDPTTRTSQFDVRRFQQRAGRPVVAEATSTSTIGPQPMFRPIAFTKVVNGKTIVESPLIPAKREDGETIIVPAVRLRWEIHTVACDLDAHLNDADFRMSLPIEDGTPVSMTDAPLSVYVWRDGAAHPGGWKKNLSLYRNARNRPASERFANSIRDARLWNLPVLVAAMGDASDPIEETLGKLLDFEESKDSLRYLPVMLTTPELHSETGFFARLNLHPPRAGEILLAAFDGEGRQTGVLLLTGRDISTGGRRGLDFLKEQAPPPRDARQLLAAVQKKALQTDRRVWLVVEGSRCGPCFRLARWLEDQRDLLERDYVFVQLNAGIDEHVDEVLERFKRPFDAGVPWFAITDADGTPLATSDGPHGNIGFPAGQPEKLHLLLMLQKTAQKLNTEDRDRLINSLGD